LISKFSKKIISCNRISDVLEFIENYDNDTDDSELKQDVTFNNSTILSDLKPTINTKSDFVFNIKKILNVSGSSLTKSQT